MKERRKIEKEDLLKRLEKIEENEKIIGLMDKIQGSPRVGHLDVVRELCTAMIRGAMPARLRLWQVLPSRTDGEQSTKSSLRKENPGEKIPVAGRLARSRVVKR